MLTVSQSAADRRLTTLTDFKAALGLTGSADDDRIEAWIRAASSAIARFCKRVFPVEGLVETVRLKGGGEAGRPLILSRIPVRTIDAIAIAGEDVDDDAFEADLDAGLVWRVAGDLRSEWPCGRSIAVSYTAGFDPIPDDVAEAAIRLVTAYRAASGRDPALRSETVDGVASYGYALPGAVGGAGGNMPGDVAALLAPYVMRTLP